MRSLKFIAVMVMMMVPTSSVFAAMADLSLVLDDEGPGTFSVNIKLSDTDNLGLAAYIFNLTGNITSFQHVSPRGVVIDPSFNFFGMGFNTFRTLDNDGVGNSAVQIRASQDTVTDGAVVIFGLGQQMGDLRTVEILPKSIAPGSLLSPEYDVPLLLVKGTYDPAGEAPNFDIDPNDNSPFVALNVFMTDATPENTRTQEVPDSEITAVVIPVPEPATFGLMSILSAGMLLRRKRA